MQSDVAELNEIATGFRRLIDQCDPKRLGGNFDRFPIGCCGDASDLMAHHLCQLGYDPPQYVLGDSGSQSHAWLETNGFIVDITADQFDDNDRCWFAFTATPKPQYLRKFRELDRWTARLSDYDARSQSILLRMYHVIVGG
ncbi:MAG: hypothetical protein ACK5YR_23310 [Pirellula sp.]